MNPFYTCAMRLGESHLCYPLLMGLANTWAVNPNPFNYHQFTDLNLPDDPVEAVLALLGWWRDSEGYDKLAELLRA